MPIKTADNKVNIYACKKATKISIKLINNTNSTDTGATPHAPLFPKESCAINIREIKLVL